MVVPALLEALPINLKAYLAWWSRHLFHLDQLCLCPPEDKASLRYVQGPPVKTRTDLHSRAPHLDANNNALILDDLGEELATVRLLVERLVEEDDPAHAVGHGGIAGEEDVAERAAVLLVVLHVDLLQTLPHGS